MIVKHNLGSDMRFLLGVGDRCSLEVDGSCRKEEFVGDHKLVTEIVSGKDARHAVVDIEGGGITVTLPQKFRLPLIASLNPGEGYQAQANRYLMGEHGRFIVEAEVERCAVSA